jgi:hypothetical protein
LLLSLMVMSLHCPNIACPLGVRAAPPAATGPTLEVAR